MTYASFQMLLSARPFVPLRVITSAGQGHEV